MSQPRIALGGPFVDSCTFPAGFPRLLRLCARVAAGGLDRRLAGGESDHACPLLRERARFLISDRARRSLARGVRLALREATPRARSCGVPVDRAAVAEARPQLETLLARLLDGSEVSARGMACLRLLLTDGFGPLYVDGEDGRLIDALTTARRALDQT